MRAVEEAVSASALKSQNPTDNSRYLAMIYFRIFTIALASAFMVIVFYGDMPTITSLLAGLCGGFVAVVAAQNNASARLIAVEKRLDDLELR